MAGLNLGRLVGHGAVRPVDYTEYFKVHEGGVGVGKVGAHGSYAVSPGGVTSYSGGISLGPGLGVLVSGQDRWYTLVQCITVPPSYLR